MPETIIAVIGPVGSGKTEYFRSLEQVLGEHFALQKAQFGIRVGETDRSREAGATATGFKYPPQINILTHQRLKGTQSEAVSCMLAFFDASGSDWHALNWENLRFLPFCSALVVICDPLYNEEVLNILLESGRYAHGGFGRELSGRLRLLKGNGNHLKTILDKMIAYLDAMGKKLPIALAVSKSDLLRHSSLMDHKTDRFAKIHVDCENILEIDEEVTDAARWYVQKFEGEIYHLLESWHPGKELTNYFAVSAFGQPPKDGIIGNRSPIRVSDPYIWCLQRMGVL